MSHKASHWLADIPASLLTAHEFRVLFHLCDAHNSRRDPETACFPSQKSLMEATGLSNGGLNNAIKAIEDKGLLRRRRTRKPDGTRGPTYYILGCDLPQQQQPTPSDGDGTNSISDGEPTPFGGQNQLHPGGVEPVKEPVKEPYAHARARERGANGQVAPCPKTGHGSESEKSPIPSPKKGHSRARKSDTNLGREPSAHACAREGPPASNAAESMPLTITALHEMSAEVIKEGKPYLCRHISARVARECLAAGLVTKEECRRSEVAL